MISKTSILIMATVCVTALWSRRTGCVLSASRWLWSQLKMRCVAEEALSLIDVALSRIALCGRYRRGARGRRAAYCTNASRGQRRVSRRRRVSATCSAAIFVIANNSSKGIRNAAFGQADEIVEETFEFPMIYQYAMEPHTAMARVTADGITLWSSSAHPFLVRSELAHMFGLPHSKVEVIVPFVGGAYGSKSYFKIEPLVVAIARKTAGRPVRVGAERQRNRC